MALGLFNRQASIELDIPGWLTVYAPGVTAPGWNVLAELAEGAAIIGCRGITVVLEGDAEGCGMAYGRHTMLRDLVAGCRPWFSAVVCNETYLRKNAEQLACGRGLVLRDRSAWGQLADPRPALGAVPPEVVGDWAVVLDLQTTLVGKSSDPAAMLAEVDASGPEVPWVLPHWAEEVGRAALASCAILLALNYVAKPHAHGTDTFVFAAEYMDELVARAASERGLKPRWAEEEA